MRLFHRITRKDSTGRLGEAVAIEYLAGRGYKIVETNYRQPFGEIDIVAYAQETLVFVEVKTRHSNDYGTPSEAVDGRKRRQLSRIAQEYIQRHRLHDAPARFDVVAILLDRDDRPVTIELIENAFDYCG